MVLNDKKVLKTIVGKSVYLTFNNDKNGNFLDISTLSLLTTYLKEADLCTSCNSIIITNKGNIFSKGMSFEEIIAQKCNKNITKSFIKLFSELLKNIRNSSKPVICVVKGEVLAGGMGIILASDMVIATEGSSFGFSEVLFGLVPFVVFPFLLERVSFKRARNMVLFSDKLSCKEAYSLGIVDKISKTEKIKQVLKKCVQKISFSSPKAISMTKKYSDRLISLEHNLKMAEDELLRVINDNSFINDIKNFIDFNQMPWFSEYK